MLPLEDYYFLLHAFDLIGRRLYPEWTGDEFDQCPIDPPELVSAARGPIDSEISALNAEEAGLRVEMGRITDDAQIKKHMARISEIARVRSSRQHDLLAMRKLDAAYERDYATHQRRVTAEGMLVGALQSDKIHAQYGRSLLIDWGFWSREPGFKYHLALSLLVAPRYHSALRRATVLIRRDEFDKWLEAALPDSAAKRAAASMAERCESWLKALIRDSRGMKPASKPSIRRDAMRDLPGLSARLFDTVWLRVAPASWQKKGAPPRRN